MQVRAHGRAREGAQHDNPRARAELCRVAQDYRAEVGNAKLAGVRCRVVHAPRTTATYPRPARSNPGLARGAQTAHRAAPAARRNATARSSHRHRARGLQDVLYRWPAVAVASGDALGAVVGGRLERREAGGAWAWSSVHQPTCITRRSPPASSTVSDRACGRARYETVPAGRLGCQIVQVIAPGARLDALPWDRALDALGEVRKCGADPRPPRSNPSPSPGAQTT